MHRPQFSILAGFGAAAPSSTGLRENAESAQRLSEFFLTRVERKALNRCTDKSKRVMTKIFRVNEWTKPETLLPRLRDPELRDCTILDLGRNLLGPEGMRGLAKIKFPRLVEIELFGNRIGDRGATFLGKAAFAKNLIRLGLGGERRYGMDNDIGEEGFASLLPNLESMVDLQLAYNRAGNAAAAAIDNCKALTRLGLGNNRVGDAGAAALAKTTVRLEHLDLSENGITAIGIAALLQSNLLHTLCELYLNGNRIGGRGAMLLGDSAFRPVRLDLNGCSIDDAGVIALAHSSVLTRVEYLGLGDNHIGEAGLEALVRSEHLTNLKSLCFRNNPAGPTYTPWLEWDGSEVGNDFDLEHATRIAAMFERPVQIT